MQLLNPYIYIYISLLKNAPSLNLRNGIDIGRSLIPPTLPRGFETYHKYMIEKYQPFLCIIYQV